MLAPEKTTIGGTEYVIGNMNALTAMNVSRLVGPIMPVIFNDLIGEIALAIKNSANDETATLDQRLTEIGLLVTTCAPVLRAIADMPEKDFTSVVTTCLSVVEKNTGKGFFKLVQNGQLMDDGIDQGTILVLVFRVLARTLRPFGSALKL